MKHFASVALPLVSLLVLAVPACEDSSSGSGAPPIGNDAGFNPEGSTPAEGTDGGDEPVASKCPAPTGAPIEH